MEIIMLSTRECVFLYCLNFEFKNPFVLSYPIFHLTDHQHFFCIDYSKQLAEKHSLQIPHQPNTFTQLGYCFLFNQHDLFL